MTPDLDSVALSQRSEIDEETWFVKPVAGGLILPPDRANRPPLGAIPCPIRGITVLFMAGTSGDQVRRN